MVTDEDYQQEVLPMLDLSLLKYKERDFMEGIFKFWGATDAQSKEAFPVSNISACLHESAIFGYFINISDPNNQPILIYPFT